jgi:hypothetical protein
MRPGSSPPIRSRTLYAPVALTKLDGSYKGSQSELVAVLALVAYFRGVVNYSDRLPREPNYVLACGDGIQAFYVLDKPATVAEARPVALALKEHAGCVSATANPAYGWWVPGNLRWSSAGVEFQPVQVVKAWDGESRTALADLKGALSVVEPEPTAAETQQDAETEEPDTHTDAWPKPLGPAAFHGLAGEVVRTLLPHSEAVAAALLLQFLAASGNAIGGHPHARVEDDRHAGHIYVAIVGASGTSRKGTSLGRILGLLTEADTAWAGERIMNGLSTGEALIHQVRDPIEKCERVKEKGQEARYENVHR